MTPVVYIYFLISMYVHGTVLMFSPVFVSKFYPELHLVVCMNKCVSRVSFYLCVCVSVLFPLYITPVSFDIVCKGTIVCLNKDMYVFYINHLSYFVNIFMLLSTLFFIFLLYLTVVNSLKLI